MARRKESSGAVKIKDPSKTIPLRIELKENQKEIVQRLKECEITILLGDPGTAKDTMQLYRAVDGLRKNEFEKIIICKPIVEIGRSMGYLPGSSEKIDPYAKSFYDNLTKLVGKDRVPHVRSQIEFNAVNFVRGNTFDENSVIILSEAQNLTLHEIISFVTRLSESSTLFINGDLHQADIKNSGLSAFLEIIKGIDGIQVIYLDDSFQMRNKMITQITKNYYKYLKK